MCSQNGKKKEEKKKKRDCTITKNRGVEMQNFEYKDNKIKIKIYYLLS